MKWRTHKPTKCVTALCVIEEYYWGESHEEEQYAIARYMTYWKEPAWSTGENESSPTVIRWIPLSEVLMGLKPIDNTKLNSDYLNYLIGFVNQADPHQYISHQKIQDIAFYAGVSNNKKEQFFVGMAATSDGYPACDVKEFIKLIINGEL